VEKARTGEAAIFVSGPEEELEHLRPLLERWAAHILFFGELGNALTAKLVTNLLTFVNAMVLGEGLIVGKRAGLDLTTLSEAIEVSFGASYVSEKHTPDIYNGSYYPVFSLGLALKDLDLMAARAEEVGTSLPIGELARERVRAAIERYGADGGVLNHLRLLEDETGTLVRP
jgi:3-hydroxyisobutyrate dehydrogenase